MLSATSTADPAPVVQLTKTGPIVTGSTENIRMLRAHFAANKWLRLTNFLDADLLELLQRKLEESDYCVIDRRTGVELRPIDCTAYLAAELLLNSPKIFRVVEQLTGCQRIACFSGRIYRRPPRAEYFNRWHTDITHDGRLLALSINLSKTSYVGGALQLRSAQSHEQLAEVHNQGIGDAIIFLIDESLEHQVGRVEGADAKTALAGWFKSKPDPASLFGRGADPV